MNDKCAKFQEYPIKVAKETITNIISLKLCVRLQNGLHHLTEQKEIIRLRKSKTFRGGGTHTHTHTHIYIYIYIYIYIRRASMLMHTNLFQC